MKGILPHPCFPVRLGRLRKPIVLCFLLFGICFLYLVLRNSPHRLLPLPDGAQTSTTAHRPADSFEQISAQSTASIQAAQSGAGKKEKRAVSVKTVAEKTDLAKTYEKKAEDPKVSQRGHLFRDLYRQEDWPEISREARVTPDQVPHTVHYVWCGENRVFQFQHYLGILSVIRLLKPLRIVFHYTHLPVLDRQWYHLWFWELKLSFASLELSPLPKDNKCDAQQLSGTALDLLSQSGGLFIGPNVALTRFLKDVQRQTFWFSTAGGSSAIIFARQGFNATKRQEFLDRIKSKERECGTVEMYNQLGASNGPPCLLLTNQIRPKDIITTRTPFAELARWLYYGERKVLEAKQSATSSIPRIAHITWLRPQSGSGKKFVFFNFLSVLSALHVAGLRHVYVYGDYRPEGEWWDRLKGENVTFVPIEAISHVYQQEVNVPAHRSDLLRTHILRAFGGVYMDGDVMWVNRLPEDLLRYPTVACPDWPSRGEWPAAFNIGVLLAQVDSPWLGHFLASMRLYLDSDWSYNAIMVPYRVYERYPESLHIDHHLQVICYFGKCHPTWHDDYIRDQNDPKPPRDFDWREGRAYHFTFPKPAKSLTSPDEIRKGKDKFAEMGRLVLTKAGRGSLIGEK